MASLAKLLAARVLLERADWQPDAVVTVGASAAQADGHAPRPAAVANGRARANCSAAMLIASGNDACLALAEHATGSAAAFVARMNEHAAALGMSDSHFKDPCGLDRARPVQHRGRSAAAGKSRRASDVRIAALVVRDRGEVATLAGRRLRYRSSNLLLGRLDGRDGPEDRHDEDRPATA